MRGRRRRRYDKEHVTEGGIHNGEDEEMDKGGETRRRSRDGEALHFIINKNYPTLMSGPGGC